MLGMPTSSDVLAAKRRLENARRMADAAWNDPFTAVTGARALVDAAGRAQADMDDMMDQFRASARRIFETVKGETR